MTIIRDSVTGRFASRATYHRSRSQGGTRYKRESITIPPPEPPLDEWEDWVIDFDHEGT